MRRDHTFYDEFHTLTNAGVNVQKVNQVRFNGGSETYIHVAAKAIACRILMEAGYAVSSEVEVKNGDIDVVCFGHPDRLSYAVEFEHSPTEEVIESKLDRYVKQTPLDDLLLVNLNNAPMDLEKLAEWLRGELGL